MARSGKPPQPSVNLQHQTLIRHQMEMILVSYFILVSSCDATNEDFAIASILKFKE